MEENDNEDGNEDEIERGDERRGWEGWVTKVKTISNEFQFFVLFLFLLLFPLIFPPKHLHFHSHFILPLFSLYSSKKMNTKN